MALYSFRTVWHVEAELPRVWTAIHDSTDWPQWWPGVMSVEEIEPGDEDGVGSLQRHIWRSVLPYRVSFDLRVTEIEPFVSLSGCADGELAGEGRWSLFAGDRETTVRYDWTVCTTRTWMNLLAPFGRPVFAWNHNAVMRNGGEGLGRLLSANVTQG